MSTLNVLRYTALATGIVYGAYETSNLYSAAQKAHADKLYAKKEALILEAKAKFSELNKKPEAVAPVSTASVSEVNFDDDKLDFGSVILAAVENLKE